MLDLEIPVFLPSALSSILDCCSLIPIAQLFSRPLHFLAVCRENNGGRIVWDPFSLIGHLPVNKRQIDFGSQIKDFSS